MQSQAYIVEAQDLERAARALHAGLLRKPRTRETQPAPALPSASAGPAAAAPAVAPVPAAKNGSRL
jgi:hypothetical protein